MWDMEAWRVVGQWVGSIGTTSAFGATYYVIRRDAKVRRQTQARKVAFYSVAELGEGRLYSGGISDKAVTHRNFSIVNLSDEPIYDASFNDVHGRSIDDQGVVLPNERMLYRLAGNDMETADKSPTWCHFRDNSGMLWARNNRGHLKQIGRGSVGESFRRGYKR